MKAIETTYFGPGNTRGARISATDNDGNTIFAGYDHAAHDPHEAAAVALCEKMNWTGKLIKGSTKRGFVFVFLPLDLELATAGLALSDVIDLGQSERIRGFASGRTV